MQTCVQVCIAFSRVPGDMGGWGAESPTRMPLYKWWLLSDLPIKVHRLGLEPASPLLPVGTLTNICERCSKWHLFLLAGSSTQEKIFGYKAVAVVFGISQGAILTWS